MTIVDNVFATPLLQRPLELGADIVVYSATKHIDGQGRCLGGAVLGSEAYCMDTLKTFMRHTGPSMSPFNAWVLLKGLETLQLRLRQHCAAALEIATALSQRGDLVRGALSGTGESSPARTGEVPDVGFRQRRHHRRRRRKGARLPLHERTPAGRYLEQSGRCQESGHPSGDDHPSAPVAGGAGKPRKSRTGWCGCPSGWRIRKTFWRTSPARSTGPERPDGARLTPGRIVLHFTGSRPGGLRAARETQCTQPLPGRSAFRSSRSISTGNPPPPTHTMYGPYHVKISNEGAATVQLLTPPLEDYRRAGPFAGGARRGRRRRTAGACAWRDLRIHLRHALADTVGGSCSAATA